MILKNKDSVAVVTVSYFSGQYLRNFLESISNNGVVSMIVVNNALDDKEIPEVIGKFPDVRLIDAPENLGYGAGMNLGVRESSPSEWLLLVNPDVTLNPDTLSELIAVGHRAERAGAIGPLIYAPSREIYPSARRLPTLRNGIGHALLSPVWKQNPWTLAYLADRENPPREREAGWLSGSCILVRRSAFEQVGGFDAKFFMYFEDVDLCARLAKAGWQIIYAPSAVVTHIGGHATITANRKMIKAHHESAYRYLASRYKAWYLLPLRGVLLVALKVRSYIARR